MSTQRGRRDLRRLRGVVYEAAPAQAPRPGRLQRLAAARLALWAWVEAHSPSYWRMRQALRRLDRQKLLWPGQPAHVYREAAYMCLPCQGDGTMGFHVHGGGITWMTDILVGHAWPHLYCVRDQDGRPWGKVLVPFWRPEHGR